MKRKGDEIVETPDDIVKEFLVESYENLDQLDRDLIALEEAPDDRERLSSIFRTIHTIKGSSGFLAYPKLENVTHVGESLLVRLRDGEIRLDTEVTSNLLSLVDAVREILHNIESVGSEGDQSYDSLVAALENLRIGQIPAALPPSGVTPAGSANGLCVEDGEPELVPERPEQSANSAAVDSSLRVDVQVLDKLMNLVGELVLARNQIQQLSQESVDAGLNTVSQRLNLITTELQEGIMKTRMQPIRGAWSRLPRIVRDLSVSCGKQVQVQMEGADTELDKTILDALRDPLTHIVRNSVDHGIENSAVRLAAGKPAEGTLRLRAFHEGGHVNIEISDDGGGIPVDRIRAKAVQQSLITAEQSAQMSDSDTVQLILREGFSTADAVTNVSGRGVGMSVINTNVERIGGRLEIESVREQGTTLRIKIPLTLAIIPALIVECCRDRYCIPQVSLIELVRLERGCARSEIELLYSVPVYRLRGQLLPLIFLDEVLGLRARRTHTECQLSEAVNFVVLQADGVQFGLVVDHINDTQEIVVKPLDRRIRSVGFYSGSTIMGDGTVALILDVIGVARRSQVLCGHTARKSPPPPSDPEGPRDLGRSWLIVEPGDGSRVAIALSSVSRLEEVPTGTIESHGHRHALQYRGSVMPLVAISNSVTATFRSAESTSLVVYRRENAHVGVLVGRIVDIVQQPTGEQSPLEAEPSGAGCSDNKIIAGRITRIVDLEQITRTAGIRIE